MRETDSTRPNCTVITGTGSFLPQTVITSSELERQRSLPAGWCVERTGIAERRQADAQDLSYHLGARAARAALDVARLDADDVDLILFSSTWSELLYPSPGVFLQRELGISRATPVIEVRAACAGFVAMVFIADPMLRAGAVRRVLCVAGERGHQCEQNYAAAAPLFGDAGAAVVLEAQQLERPAGVLYTRFYTTADEAERCLRTTGVPHDAWLARADLPLDERNPTRAHWDGASIFRNAVTCLGQATEAALLSLQLEREDIDHYIYHQANKKILDALSRQFSIPAERVAHNIGRVGNTSSASVPLLLSEAMAEGRIRPGQRLLLGAFGAGYAYGVVVYEVPEPNGRDAARESARGEVS